VEELECEDFVLVQGLAVERKEANDFALSIMDRRIFSQIPIMKRAYARQRRSRPWWMEGYASAWRRSALA